MIIAESLQGAAVIARHTAVVLGLERSRVGDESALRAGLGGHRDRSRLDRGRHGSRRPRGWNREPELDADAARSGPPGADPQP